MIFLIVSNLVNHVTSQAHHDIQIGFDSRFYLYFHVVIDIGQSLQQELVILTKIISKYDYMSLYVSYRFRLLMICVAEGLRW